MLGQQSSDGGWRSDVYGPFKDGPSLTPLVLPALPAACPPARTLETGCRKGAAYLARWSSPTGPSNRARRDLSYPVYTSAGAVQVLSQPESPHRKARDAWLAYLRQRQLTEDLGWQPADKPYGGWGYSPRLPRKPKPGEALPPLTESNLSATLFALEALRSAGVKADDPAYPQGAGLRAALPELQR